MQEAEKVISALASASQILGRARLVVERNPGVMSTSYDYAIHPLGSGAEIVMSLAATRQDGRVVEGVLEIQFENGAASISRSIGLANESGEDILWQERSTTADVKVLIEDLEKSVRTVVTAMTGTPLYASSEPSVDQEMSNASG